MRNEGKRSGGTGLRECLLCLSLGREGSVQVWRLQREK